MIWLAAGNVTLVERLTLLREAWVRVPIESPIPRVNVPPYVRLVMLSRSARVTLPVATTAAGTFTSGCMESAPALQTGPATVMAESSWRLDCATRKPAAVRPDGRVIDDVMVCMGVERRRAPMPTRSASTGGALVPQPVVRISVTPASPRQSILIALAPTKVLEPKNFRDECSEQTPRY